MSTPTTLHKQSRKRDRSPVLSAESMAIYGPEHARLANGLRQPAPAPTFLSLFAGIGGIDLGLERAGFRCVGQVEIDPFCRRVLAKHWPDVPRFEDVRTFTKDNISEPIDLIAGGFPCQDISLAGGRTGLSGERSGLWGQMLRLIRELRPRFVVVENVAALLIPDRFGNVPIATVLGDLAGLRLNAEWSTVSACSMGAPHVRRRVFVVAHADSLNGWSRVWDSAAQQDRSLQAFDGFAGARAGWAARMANPSALYRDADGVPSGMDRNRGIGNAVVPQVAEWIGRRILAAMEGATHV